MKLTRRQKETIGFSMLISAGTTLITAVAAGGHKKRVLLASGIMATLEGVAGYLLLTDPKPRKAEKDTAEELFDPEECREANGAMRRILGGRHGGEVAPSVLREILKDEEATEADFQ